MKKIRNLCAVLSVLFLSAVAQANFTNFRYGLTTGPMLELGFGKIGLGFSATNVIYSGADYTATAVRLGGKLSYYFKEFAVSSAYLSADYGQIKADYSQTNLSSGLVFTGSGTSSYSAASVGYHWFWGWFNMNLGIGIFNATLKDVTLTSANGTTSVASGLSLSTPILDFGFGVSFF